MNLLGPKNGGESGRRTVFERFLAADSSHAATTTNDCVLPQAKLGLASSALSGSSPLAYARR